MGYYWSLLGASTNLFMQLVTFLTQSRKVHFYSVLVLDFICYFVNIIFVILYRFEYSIPLMVLILPKWKWNFWTSLRECNLRMVKCLKLIYKFISSNMLWMTWDDNWCVKQETTKNYKFRSLYIGSFLCVHLNRMLYLLW